LNQKWSLAGPSAGGGWIRKRKGGSQAVVCGWNDKVLGAKRSTKLFGEGGGTHWRCRPKKKEKGRGQRDSGESKKASGVAQGDSAKKKKGEGGWTGKKTKRMGSTG